ncbi:hypothetical protein [Albirhodobacter sp. R86504]|jgi:hypothetical protein
MLGFALKAIVILTLLAGICIAGYAYLGDMSADATQTEVPVELDATQ